MFIFR